MPGHSPTASEALTLPLRTGDPSLARLSPDDGSAWHGLAPLPGDS